MMASRQAKGAQRKRGAHEVANDVSRCGDLVLIEDGTVGRIRSNDPDVGRCQRLESSGTSGRSAAAKAPISKGRSTAARSPAKGWPAAARASPQGGGARPRPDRRGSRPQPRRRGCCQRSADGRPRPACKGQPIAGLAHAGRPPTGRGTANSGSGSGSACRGSPRGVAGYRGGRLLAEWLPAGKGSRRLRRGSSGSGGAVWVKDG
ncbi:hypothetical protein BHE74_00039982 [Ensete ventricosum]|nr:hypothetical protein BHE74_00039982 [Ensete ventricosum]